MTATIAASGLGASIAASLVQVIVIVLGGPLVLGLMAKVRARAEGRVGAPIHQPLDPSSEWIEESHRRQGGGGDSER